MKSKEVIRQMLELDPSGEIEVFCDGDIFFLVKLPAYYDGRPETLIRDTNVSGYNVIGLKQLDKNAEKIQIVSLTDDDVIENAIDFKIKIVLEGSDEFKDKIMKKYQEVNAQNE